MPTVHILPFRGVLPKIWRHAKYQTWLLCWVNNQDASLLEHEDLDYLVKAWNHFCNSLPGGMKDE